MRITSFGAKNFFGYQELFLDLRELEPLVLIDGQNYDFATTSSNGAGKSTIADVWSYALFGRTLRGVERHGKDSVVRAGSKGGAAVWLEADLPVGRLRVERYRQHQEQQNKICAWLDGKDVLRGRYASETDARLEQLLGFNYDLFRRAVVIHSRLTQSVSTLENRYIKQITERLLGITNLEKLDSYVREQIVECESAAAAVIDKLTTAKGQRDAIRAEVDDLIVRQRNYVEQLKHRRAEITTELEQSAANEADYAARHKKLLAAAAAVREELASIEVTKRRLKDAAVTAAAEHAKATNALAELNTELRLLRQQQQRYANMSDKECPECGQVVKAAHIAAKLRVLNAQLETLVKRCDEAKAVCARCNEQLFKCNIQVATYDEATTDKPHRLAIIQRDIGTMAERLKAERARRKELTKQLAELAADPYKELLARARQRLAAAEDTVVKLVNESKAYEDKKRYLEFWRFGFGPNGLRSFMLDGATPALNRLANFYLSQLTDNTMTLRLDTVSLAKDGTYKDKFDIDVTNDYGAQVLGGDSDGELAAVDFALCLAMADMLSSRIEGGLGLLFVDQAIDNFDSVRAAKAVALLRQKTDAVWCAENGVTVKDSVFLISHKPDVQDGFNCVLRAEKRNGICTLKQ